MTNYNILIVDANHRERNALCRELEACGYHVVTSHDGTDAVKKIAENGYRLVISEFHLPDMSGVDLYQEMMAKNDGLAILFSASKASVQDAVDAMKLGALDFLLKPLDHTHIRSLIESLFDENGGASGGRGRKPEPVEIISENATVLDLLRLARKVADSTASVMIQGESGTGKELFARYVHAHSSRSSKPFVAVNCAALPETLLESELFGHEKGAFTGAVSRKPGKFELADGGTILLDEVTEMQYHLQSKLLRILQEKEIDRVGGMRPFKVDVRVIATSNRDIQETIRKGAFREDLFYRLNTVPLRIPPLRDRPGDIRLLAEHFIQKYNRIDGRNVKSLTAGAFAMLEKHPFVGNVRELENIIQRGVLLAEEDLLKERDLFWGESGTGNTSHPGGGDVLPSGLTEVPLKEVEKKMIFHTLDKTQGNRTHAAKLLGISVRTLRNKLNEYKESISED